MTDLSEVRANIEILQFVKARMAELKEMQALSRAVIEETLGDNETGVLDGKVVVTFKHIKTHKLNQAQLKAEYPEIYEECSYDHDGRRFEVK